MGLHTSGYTLRLNYFRAGSSLASGDFYKIDLGLARPPLLRGPQMPRWPITPSSRLPYYVSRNWNYCLVFGRTGTLSDQRMRVGLLVPLRSSRITSGVNLKLAYIIQVVRRLSRDSAHLHLHHANRAMDTHGRAGYGECAIYLFRLQRSKSPPLRG